LQASFFKRATSAHLSVHRLPASDAGLTAANIPKQTNQTRLNLHKTVARFMIKLLFK
jgi:hypothetical protein